MNLDFSQQLIGRAYRVQITESPRFAITPEERARLDQFGDMTVEIGGVIQNESDVTVVTLPSVTVAVPSGLPVSQLFSLDDTYAGEFGAVDAANAWIYRMQQRINAALATLMGESRQQPSVVTVKFPLP